MITSGHFIWQHFPKTGGHAVDQALRSLSAAAGLKHDQTGDRLQWHDSVALRGWRDRGFDPGGRVIISGIRRLPHWIVSRVHFDASRPPYLCATRQMLRRGEFFEEGGAVRRADDYARLFTLAPVHRWIRTEHLSEDFLAAFADLLPHPLLRAAARKLRRIVNGTQFNYLRTLDFYFTDDELTELYEANPIWAAIEREVYGSLLTARPGGADCWYIVDRGMRIVAGSDGALAWWRLSRDEILGRALGEVFPMAVGSEVFQAHEEVMRSRQERSFRMCSPTYGEKVDIALIPRARDLQVRFDPL